MSTAPTPYPVECPYCNGTGKCPKWGECLICAGWGTVLPDLATTATRIRVDNAQKKVS